MSSLSFSMKWDSKLRNEHDCLLLYCLTIVLSVLGLVGTVGNCNEGCNPNNPSVNGRYQCSGANTVYSDLTNGVELLLENRGGPGTACGHWEESSFRTNDNSELMTGFFEEDLFQPISLVTVAALDDLGGYEVDFW